MHSPLFFRYTYLQQAKQAQLPVKNLRKILRVAYNIRELIRRFWLIHKHFEPFSFFSEEKKMNTV